MGHTPYLTIAMRKRGTASWSDLHLMHLKIPRHGNWAGDELAAAAAQSTLMKGLLGCKVGLSECQRFLIR